MADHLRTLPEIFENNVSECLVARTKALGRIVALGPPDLCHITKVQEKPQSILRSGPAPASLIGSYHHIYGLDCSSPAAIAAYFTTLVNDLGNPNMSKGIWRIQSGTYCSYNAFARVDVRVEVTMPGSVNAYVLDAQGRRFGCDDRMWQEVHVCAVLRALYNHDPFADHIECLRYLYPIETPADEATFLKAAEALFFEGKFLGTDELTAPPNNVNNRLAVGVMNYFSNSLRYAQVPSSLPSLAVGGLDFFSRFQSEDPEVVALIASAMDQFEQTSSAVHLLARTLLTAPPSAPMMLCESQLLLNMGQPAKALELTNRKRLSLIRFFHSPMKFKIAKLAVDLAPAQAKLWLNLATMYVVNEDFAMALIALNVAPMAHVNEDFAMALIALNVAPMAHGIDQAQYEPQDNARISNGCEIIQDMMDEEGEGDQTLASLPANSLRGTFVDAYQVLTRILSVITWDTLLMYRSNVFLMENEYAVSAKADQSESVNDVTEGINHLDVTNQRESMTIKEEEEQEQSELSESIAEEKETAIGQTTNPNDPSPNGEPTDADYDKASEAISSSIGSSQNMGRASIERVASPTPIATRPVPGGKRLLERWLDQLFTALYQDLMCSVIWTAQDQHARRTHSHNDHTIGDYLRFGILSKRLGRKEEACRAFQMCTSRGFCLRGHLHLLDTYSSDGFVEETLATVDTICRFYETNSELTVPHTVYTAVFRLIAKHGLTMMTQLARQWINQSAHVRKIIDRACVWKFMNNQLIKAATTPGLASLFTVDVIPYGNARVVYNGSTDQYAWTCQHGTEECLGNIMMARQFTFSVYLCIYLGCAIAILENWETWLPYIVCLEQTNPVSPAAAVKICAKEMNIKHESIARCSNSKMGQKIQYANAVRTNDLNPPHQWVPWIVIDRDSSEATQ
eukprot:Ihof_evm2s211 gene=Ihof_evmTU2s211